MSAASIVVAAFSPSSRGDLPSPRSRCLVLRNVARRVQSFCGLESYLLFRARLASLVCFLYVYGCVFIVLPLIPSNKGSESLWNARSDVWRPVSVFSNFSPQRAALEIEVRPRNTI